MKRATTPMTDAPNPFTPTGGDQTPLPDATAFRTARHTLIELLEVLPETRLSTATPRHGWTLRHELAWLAAADLELTTRIQLATTPPADEPHWRRLRGEAMHLAQEMRLHQLRDHLAETGKQAAATLKAHPDSPDAVAVRTALADHTRATASTIAIIEKVLDR
jgi:hypothetical protein